MEFRPYRETDYEAVCAFLIALNREDRSHINWNWARFEWMYEHPEFDKASMASIGLWVEERAVVGIAVYDMYFGEAFCGVLPGWEDLYPGVLDYAWRALRDEKGLGIGLCETNGAECAAARAAGFVPAEQRETVLRIDLDRPLPVTLPPELRLAELDPGEDLEGFRWLLWQGFDHGADRAEFEAAEEPPGRRRVHFDPRLSLTARTPSGEATAYCCLWYRPDTDYAYVEPVCTVPAWRGRGVAGALVSEALNRARALGARSAYVISDLDFYRRLGFREALQIRFYRKR